MRVTTILAVLALVTCGGETPAPSPERAGHKDLFPVWGDFVAPYDIPTSCSPASCSGCCSGIECLAGNGTGACGTGGDPCQTCKTAELCQAGSCIPPKCDDTTCAGCCDTASACKPGSTAGACGSKGVPCAACDTDQVCADGFCAAKGPPMYKVTLVSAKVTGSAWLVCGFAELSDCDLYVILKVGTASAQSTTKSNTQSPVWNEYLLTATETALLASFNVEVRDDDSPLGSVKIGSCSPKLTAAQLSAGKLIVDCGDAKSVTFSFQKI
jgi:hypothetical protein